MMPNPCLWPRESDSPFSQLAAPPERIFVQEAHRAKLLAPCCGTYAFHDREGDLLYIGKAKNVRARVLSHLRRPAAHPLLLRPWTHLIARIEVRFAPSEMEALLVEADLVGRLRPRFNRQMSSWHRYCYLIATRDRSNPLSVSCQHQSFRRCFGPYRSRRQAVEIVEAVFRLLAHAGRTETLTQCYSLLHGEDESLLVELERQCQEMAANQQNDPWSRFLTQAAEVLRTAFDRAVLLRDAKRLLGAMIVLPGSTEVRRVAVMTRSGLHLDVIGPTAQAAAAFLERHRQRVAAEQNETSACLPKAVADRVCVAVREVRKNAGRCCLVPAADTPGLSPGDLIALLYGRTEMERQGSD